MPTVITVERESASRSASSRSNSFTDEGSSTGTGVHVSHPSGSQEDSDLLDDQSWDPVYSDEIEPSESASRPRPTHYRRSHSRPTSVRRGPVRRHTTSDRTNHRASRVHRHPAPNPPSSVDPQDDYPAYGRGILPPNGPYGGRVPQPGYAQSFVSFSPPLGANAGQVMPYGGPAAYPYPQNPFSPAAGVGGQGYFGPHHQPPAHGMPGYVGHEMMAYGPVPGYGYGGYGIPGPQGQYYPHIYQNPPSPPEPPAAPPSAVSAATLEKEKAAAVAAALEKEKVEKEKEKAEKERSEIEKKLASLGKMLEDSKIESERRKQEAERLKRETEEKKMASLIEAEKAKREADEKKLAALERLLADTKHEAEKAKKLVDERTAADKKAADDAAAKEATDKRVKEEVAKVRAEADKKTKAAEEAKTKAEEEKKAADEAKAKAEAEAKALAAPPTDKKKPIKFKDAVGRKFSFPFHLCKTWTGMEELIRQAFLHVEVIGPHVAEGHYDLVGPNGEIILPQVWETMIEPDWAITMHMWPMPEPPKGAPDGVNVIDVGPGRSGGARRRDRADQPIPPPPGRGGRRGPPPPPPGWIGPPPGSRMGGHDVGGGEPPEIIVIGEENGTVRSSKKKSKSSGGVLGIFGGSSGAKPSGKGLKKVESYDVCRVM